MISPSQAPERSSTERTMQVLHVGNDIGSHTGGISQVIRDHLERDLPDVGVTSIASYDPSASTAVRRQLPALRAALTLLRRSLSRRAGPVVHLHLADRGSLVREGSLTVLARLLGFRVVVTWHASDGLRTLPPATQFVLRVVVAAAHRTTVLSAAHARALGDRASVRVVPNDVAVPATTVPMARRRPVIVFAGEVGRRKGADVLRRAWELIDAPGWTLEVFGRTENGWQQEESELRALPGVRVHGLVPSSTVSSALSTAAIAVLPSRAEALPMFLLEAMSAGCAVVGTTAGAVPELLADGAGLVVPAGDAEALAEALRRLVHSEELRREVQVSARERVGIRYGRPVVSESWSSLYRDLVPARGHRSSA